MPVIKSAKKKLKQDKKRTIQNAFLKLALKNILKKAVKSPSQAVVQQAFKIADKAAKHHIIHKNKASRIKAKMAKMLTTDTPKTAAKAKAAPAKTKKKTTGTKKKK